MIYIPDMNPIHFVKRQNYDYVDTFPLIDNFASNHSFKGVYAKQYYQVWAKDKALEFQLEFASTDTVVVYPILNDVFGSAITPTDITPTGWLSGNKRYLYSYTPAAVGDVWFMINCTTTGSKFDSEKIKIKESLDSCVRIDYFCSNGNLYNMIFWDTAGTTQVYSGLIYLEGKIKTPIEADTYSTYTDDGTMGASLTKLSAQIRNGYILELYELPEYMVKKIKIIFACNIIQINNTQFQNESPPEPDAKGENSNIYDVKVEVFESNYEGFETDDRSEFQYLVDENGIFIIDENGHKIII